MNNFDQPEWKSELGKDPEFVAEWEPRLKTDEERLQEINERLEVLLPKLNDYSLTEEEIVAVKLELFKLTEESDAIFRRDRFVNPKMDWEIE